MIKSRLNLRNVATVIACLTVTMFASCKKDPTPDPIFLLEERQVGTERYVYEYDDQNRLTKRSRYENGILQGVDIFKYDPDGHLEELEYGNLKHTFTKNGDKITFDYHGVLAEIELNAQGHFVKRKSVNEYSKSTQTFTWQNGNLTKVEAEYENIHDAGTWTRTYTHDNKKSPFYYCKTPKWVLWLWLVAEEYNENNIETVETIDEVEGDDYYEHEYTYNTDGLPTKRTASWGGEPTTYKYMKR